jgi:hypothetical protein
LDRSPGALPERPAPEPVHRCERELQARGDDGRWHVAPEQHPHHRRLPPAHRTKFAPEELLPHQQHVPLGQLPGPRPRFGAVPGDELGGRERPQVVDPIDPPGEPFLRPRPLVDAERSVDPPVGVETDRKWMEVRVLGILAHPGRGARRHDDYLPPHPSAVSLGRVWAAEHDGEAIGGGAPLADGPPLTPDVADERGAG